LARGVFALSCARLSGKSVMPRRRKPAGPTSPPHTSEMSEPAQLIHLEILRPAKGQRCSKGAALGRSTGCATSRREPEKATREATAVHAESDSSRSRGITRPTFWSITTGFACRRGSRPEGRSSPDQEDAWHVKRLPGGGRRERGSPSAGTAAFPGPRHTSPHFCDLRCLSEQQPMARAVYLRPIRRWVAALRARPATARATFSCQRRAGQNLRRPLSGWDYKKQCVTVLISARALD
jgi:hypothetical protein